MILYNASAFHLTFAAMPPKDLKLEKLKAQLKTIESDINNGTKWHHSSPVSGASAGTFCCCSLFVMCLLVCALCIATGRDIDEHLLVLSGLLTQLCNNSFENDAQKEWFVKNLSPLVFALLKRM
jgi:hypothetical protein